MSREPPDPHPAENSWYYLLEGEATLQVQEIQETTIDISRQNPWAQER